MKKSSMATGLALGVFWGCTYMFQKWSAPFVTPMQVAFVRVLFGFLPVAAYGAMSGVLHWKHIRHAHHFFVMSLLSATVYYYAVAAGTALLPSGIAGLLSGAIPIFTFLCSWSFLRTERLTALKGAGVLLGFCGILLIAAPWSQSRPVNPVGVAYMLFAALCFGSSFVYARRFLTPLQLPAVALTTYQMAAALPLLLWITPVQSLTSLGEDLRAMLALVVGLGLLSSGIAYVAFYRLIEKEGAVTASMVTYLPPVVALMLGALDGEPITSMAWIAVAAILAGVGLVQYSDLRQAKRMAAA